MIIPFSFAIQTNSTFEENFPVDSYECITDYLGEINPFLANMTGLNTCSLDNEYFFVSHLKTLGAKLSNVTVNASYNTKDGGRFSSLNISATSVISNLLFEFEGLATIRDYTNFSFYCSKHLQTNGQMFIVWGKENGSYYGMSLDDINIGGDSTCNFFGFNGNQDCCDINDELWFNDLCLNANATKINFSGQDLLNGCSAWDNFNDGTIKLFGFRAVDNQQGRTGVIDDILIQNIMSGINEIPIINFSFTQDYYCINETSNLAVIEFNITTYDDENDTLYYATGTSLVADFIYVKYFKEKCEVKNFLGITTSYKCDYEPFYDYLTNVIYTNESCQICTTGDDFLKMCLKKSSTHKDYLIQEGDILTVSGTPNSLHSGLILRNECLEENERYTWGGTNAIYTYELDKSYSDLAYTTAIYGLESDENFDLNFLDSDFNNIISIRIVPYNSHLQLYTLNTSNEYELFFNQSINYNVTSFHLITNDSNDLFSFSMHDNNGNDYIVSGIESNVESEFIISTFKYVQINFTDSEDILQAGFKYSGLTKELDWQSDFSNTYNTSTVNRIPISIFVTDSIHLNTDEYNYDIQYINVYDSDNPVCALPYIKKVEAWDYENVNGFTGVPYYIDVLLWLLRFPSRLLKEFNLYTQALAGSVIVLVIGFFVFLNRYRNMKDTIVSLFISAIILYFLNVVYLDIFVIIAFFFSYFITQDFIPDVAEDREIKHLFFSYLIFFVIMFLTGLSSVSNISITTLNLLNVENILSFTGIINIMGTIITIFISFLLFVIVPIEQNYISLLIITIINIFIIMIKTVVIFQLLQYLKKLIEALPFF